MPFPPQVFIGNGGNVSFAAGTWLQCPSGTVFRDAYHGLYGPGGAYPVTSPLCVSTPILQSTLQFDCARCGPGLYTLLAGNSSGAPGVDNNVSCLPCPIGGVCQLGNVAAAAGWWGAADAAGAVSFAPCPDGYCCDSEGCAGVDACVGHRDGPLCGGCAAGFVHGVGAADCVADADCGRDSGVVAAVLAAVAVVDAVLQLAVVSDVLLPARDYPTGKLKLLVYFFQVRALVAARTTA